MNPDVTSQLVYDFNRFSPFEAELALDGVAKDMARGIAGMREEYAARIVSRCVSEPVGA